MDMLNVKINGISVSVEKGSTILDAARAAGVEIPTLCFMKEKNEIGACRICVVEANEGRGFRMRLPRKRGYGGSYQHRKNSESKKDYFGANSFNS